jgi:hypothetical protein
VLLFEVIRLLNAFSFLQLEAGTTQQVFTPYLTEMLLSMVAVHGNMRLTYLYSSASSMPRRDLEQLFFGTGKWVMS